jgi:hypothetical protein
MRETRTETESTFQRMHTEVAVYPFLSGSWRSPPAPPASNSTAYTEASVIERQHLIIHRAICVPFLLWFTVSRWCPLVLQSWADFRSISWPAVFLRCLNDSTRRISLRAAPCQTKPHTWLHACRNVFTPVATSQNYIAETLLFTAIIPAQQCHCLDAPHETSF